MDNKNKNYIKTLISYIALLLITVIIAFVFTKILPKNSFGADSQTINLQANIKKYINYKISDQEKGTLLQYDVKTGIDYKEDEEQYIPVKQSQIKLEMNQIDNKYPYDVKVIARSTEATNGKKRDISELYRYNNETGILIIQASNVNENGELINKEKINKEAQDEYTVICNYDTYIEEAEQREIDIKAEAIVLLSEDNRMISKKEEFKGTVQNNIGELTSVEYVNSDIYNGNIKSNIINGTNYDTEYKETQKIVVSKKEAQDEIWIIERNSFINTENNQIETDLGNNGELLYKSTKLYKSNLVRLLGEEGTLVILDSEKNLIATIDKNTEYDKDGTKTINYQDNIESIIIKTSKIQNEGILELENTKAIKNTMRKTQNVKINTTTHLFGVKNVLKNNETIKEQVYRNEKENTIEIKDSTTDVKFDINKTEWTNKEQNELVFDISLNTSSIKNNLFKNPSIKIELPKEVEKVILGDSHIVYGNGLEFRDVHVENDENGMFNIIASIEGSQTTFNENSLGLNTNIKIPATVILKKDIQSEKENIKLLCTNDFTLDDNKEVINKNVEIEITSYQQEDVNNGEVTNQEVITTMLRQSAPSETIQNQEKIEGLDLEVVPVKGDTVLKDGDTVYEGEFIKYNIKVTNTSDRQIDNIKIVGSIPEGTTYGELEADYYVALGKYEYNFDELLKEKIIEIGSLESGKSVSTFYEVKVNKLENQDVKQIQTEIKTFIGENKNTNYKILNICKKSDIQVFLSADLDNARDRWNYHIKATSNQNKNVTLKLKVPKEFELQCMVILHENGKSISTDDEKIKISTDGSIITNLEIKPQEDQEWIFEGTINSMLVKQRVGEIKTELTAVASIFDEDIVYKSNENRIIFETESISILMSSDNEGEEIKYNDEINYILKITNTGRTNLNTPLYSYISINLKDYLPEEVIPISLEYEDWIEILDNNKDSADGYIPTGIFNKEIQTKDIGYIYTDENEKKEPNIDLNLIIPYNKSITIKIRTKAGSVYKRTKIENSATVTGDYILTKNSNTISHIILPFDYSESNQDNPDNPDNPEKPNNQDNKEETSDTKQKYSISGVAWFDINQDGQRQISEELLSGINVMLVDANNATNIQEKKLTDSNGEYIFSNLDKGSYIVMFDYDTNKYSLTDYQKEGVNSALNSDAMSKEITISGSKTKVGLTDSILLDASVKNIDVGLIKNKICDLKLDKYISKVTVNTASGVKEQSYERSQLAKVEIKSKEIQGATVLVEYKIVVTNEGEIPTSANKIIDYIPYGLQFSSELNKDWSINKSGELINNSLSNRKIQPNESVELYLVLTKSMTSNSTGTYRNCAEIGEMDNSLEIKDTDSFSYNKIETEDDYSKADLIISVSTGIVIYISAIFTVILFVVIVIYIYAKTGIIKIKKKNIFGVMLVLTIALSSTTNYAEDFPKAPETARFQFLGGDRFENRESVGIAHCINTGIDTPSNYRLYRFVKLLDVRKKTNSIESSADLKLKKLNTDNDVQIKQIGENYILGPLKISRSNNNTYVYKIETNKKHEDNALNGSTCDENGNLYTVRGDVDTFYLKTSVNNIGNDEHITKVRIQAQTKVNRKTEEYQYGHAQYTVCEGAEGPRVTCCMDISRYKNR